METVSQKFVVISRRARRITLQRFLLSKVVYEEKNFTPTDLLGLFLNQLWLESKCRSDAQFREKFGKSLEDLSSILKELNFRTEFTDRAMSRFRMRIKNKLEKFYFEHRNYTHIRIRYNGFVQPVDPTLRNLEKRSKKLQRRRIGIGYRDKGTLKNPAVDGSPSWQEVATHRGPLYGGTNEKEKPIKTTNCSLKYICIKKPKDLSS